MDVACSAVLGPCLLTALNYLWFRSARVSVVNEHHLGSHAGIPLASLLAVSTSTGGSYDFRNLAALLRGNTWRLTLLAALTLLSAIAKSAVSNIIAYEAYTRKIEQTSLLRSLSDRSINLTTFIDPSLSSGSMDAQGFMSTFSTSQQSDVANRISGLLTGLSFEDATSKLDNGTYISMNSTRSSMDNLPPTVTSLLNVPGFRLTVDCAVTDQPGKLDIVMGRYHSTEIHVRWENEWFRASYPGVVEDIQTAYLETDQFAAFRLSDNTEVYIGYFAAFDTNNTIISSAYGDIKPHSANVTSTIFGATKGAISHWGIRCWLNRQDGFLNYTRIDGQKWSISQSKFFSKAVKVPSSLANWQTNLNYRAPGSTLPGIGAALAQSAGQPQYSVRCHNASDYCGYQCDNATDFSKLALNYLYASGESEWILYEVAALNSTRDGTELWYNVSSTAAKEYYRITYIPAILVVSIVSLFAAAAATAAMAAYRYRTYSARQFRQVDVLRLVVNCLDGLQEANAEKEIAGFPRAKLENWAAHCRVVYEKDKEGEQTRVKLRQATPAGS